MRWSAPRQVNTRHGKRLVRTAVPTPDFWDLWKRDSGAIKAQGMMVARDPRTGRWDLSLWAMPDGRETPQARELARQIDADHQAALAVPEIELDPAGLLPFQVGGAKRLLASLLRRHAGLDASATGTGKTFVALAAARQLAQPLAVVAPLAVLPSWNRAAAHMGVTPAAVVNYERARRGVPGLVEAAGAGFRWMLPAGSTIVFDEAHVAKGYPPTLNARLVRSAFDQGHRVILLSATLANTPTELWAAGYVLGLWQAADFPGFLADYGCRREGREWVFQGGAAVMRRLHRSLFPERGNRLRHSDVQGFPENHVSVEAIEFGPGLARVYAEMDAELAALAEREATSPGRNDPRVVLLRARQRVELLKVPTLAGMARDLVAEGKSVALFVNFDATVTALASALDTPAVVRGGQSPEARQAVLDGFNADPPATRVIVLNIASGGAGISLHDLHGGRYPRAALICPGFSAVHLKQALGRCHRAGGRDVLTRVLFAAGTVEEVTMKVVAAKLGRLDQLNDGHLAAAPLIPPTPAGQTFQPLQ